MKVYEFEMKAYQLAIKKYHKYQIDMLENINFICSKILIYGNIRDQN